MYQDGCASKQFRSTCFLQVWQSPIEQNKDEVKISGIENGGGGTGGGREGCQCLCMWKRPSARVTHTLGA
jgi:hypothetical protein